MWNLEDLDSVLEDGQAVRIIPLDKIANVAVDKQLPGGEADDFVCRHAAVRAADPKISRPLDRAETFEKPGIVADLLRGPHPVVLEKLRQKAHRCSFGWESSGRQGERKMFHHILDQVRFHTMSFSRFSNLSSPGNAGELPPFHEPWIRL
jgi:hypothetical protein